MSRPPRTRGVIRRGRHVELSLTRGHGALNLRWLAPWLQNLVVMAWNRVVPREEGRLARRCLGQLLLSVLVLVLIVHAPAALFAVTAALAGWLALKLADEIASSPRGASRA